METRVNKNLWRLEIGGRVYWVQRHTKKHSRTVEPRFGHIPGCRKPRFHTTSTWYTASRSAADPDGCPVNLTRPGDVPPRTKREAVALAYRDSADR